MPESRVNVLPVDEIVSALKSVPHRVLWVIFTLIGAVTTRLNTRNEDIWLFGAHHGDQFTENTKYLFLHVSNEHADEVRPIWLSRNSQVVSELQNAGYEAYNYRRPGALLLKLRAEIVVVSHLLDDIGWWPLVGGAKVVNTTHGVAIKDTTQEVQRRARDLLVNHYVVSTSKHHDSMLTKRTWTKDNDVSLVTGYPRDDVIFEEIEGSELIGKSHYDHIRQLTKTKTILSYHPTHRNTGQNPLLDNEQVLSDVNQFLQHRNTVLLVKPHPSQEMRDMINKYSAIEPVPPELDIYPVMDSIDILITDYSSLYFDFLLTGRRPLLFPYDIEAYKETVGIHPDIDYQELGRVAYSTNELKSILDEYLQADEIGISKQQKKIRDQTVEFLDGNSSERLYQAIRKQLLLAT